MPEARKTTPATVPVTDESRDICPSPWSTSTGTPATTAASVTRTARHHGDRHPVGEDDKQHWKHRQGGHPQRDGQTAQRPFNVGWHGCVTAYIGPQPDRLIQEGYCCAEREHGDDPGDCCAGQPGAQEHAYGHTRHQGRSARPATVVVRDDHPRRNGQPQGHRDDADRRHDRGPQLREAIRAHSDQSPLRTQGWVRIGRRRSGPSPYFRTTTWCMPSNTRETPEWSSRTSSKSA